MVGERVVGLVVFALVGCLCDAQWRPLSSKGKTQAVTVHGLPAPTQAATTTRLPYRRPTLPQVYATVGPTVKAPLLTTVPAKTAVEYPPLVKPDTVKAQCGESSVQVVVDMDLLGIGHLIQPSDITLGRCAPVGQDNSGQVLLFESELQGCGSTLTMTEDSLVYTFALYYQPKALGATPIIRTDGVVVGIECHYMRLHNVSSNALKPTWIPYRSTLSGEDLLVFTLRLMTDDWMQERMSNVFFLGDLMNIEASVAQANHVLLRVFVDTCVATLEPKADAVPRYAFIENQGCLMDSKLTSSRSKFLPRVQDDKLHFQLDAFRFAQESRSNIYIVCHLKATAASPDTEGKACSFSGSERWTDVHGNDQACSCCDTSCTGRKGRSLADSAAQWQGDATLGPILVQQVSPNDVVIQSQSATLKTDAHRATGVSPEAVVMAGVVAAVGLVCLVVLWAVILWRPRKPTLYSNGAGVARF